MKVLGFAAIQSITAGCLCRVKAVSSPAESGHVLHLQRSIAKKVKKQASHPANGGGPPTLQTGRRHRMPALGTNPLLCKRVHPPFLVVLSKLRRLPPWKPLQRQQQQTQRPRVRAFQPVPPSAQLKPEPSKTRTVNRAWVTLEEAARTMVMQPWTSHRVAPKVMVWRISGMKSISNQVSQCKRWSSTFCCAWPLSLAATETMTYRCSPLR